VRWGAVRFSVKAPGLLGGGRGWPPSRTCSGGALYGPGGPDLRPGPHRPAGFDPAAAAPSSPRPPMPIIDQPPESRFASLLKTFFDSIDPSKTSLIGKHTVRTVARDSGMFAVGFRQPLLAG